VKLHEVLFDVKLVIKSFGAARTVESRFLFVFHLNVFASLSFIREKLQADRAFQLWNVVHGACLSCGGFCSIFFAETCGFTRATFCVCDQIVF
jgi:hypothetical protein